MSRKSKKEKEAKGTTENITFSKVCDFCGSEVPTGGECQVCANNRSADDLDPKVSEQIMGDAEKARMERIVNEASEAVREKGVGFTCPNCALINELGRVTCRGCRNKLMKKRTKKAKGKVTTPKEKAPVAKDTAPKAGKKEDKSGKTQEKKARTLKYGFDKIEAGKFILIPGADKPAGKVTVHENVRVLSYEYGKRKGLTFEVSKTDGGQVKVQRVA